MPSAVFARRGPYAVPFLVEALRRPGLSDADRGLLVRNMGRLESSTIPALAAALESSEPAVAAAAATAMGSIGDARGRAVLDVPGAPAPRVVGSRPRCEPPRRRRSPG